MDGTKVLKLESKNTAVINLKQPMPKGNKHGSTGVIHEFTPNRKSHGHLKWRIRLLAFSLRSMNLKNS
jgi:hypothetical protein